MATARAVAGGLLKHGSATSLPQMHPGWVTDLTYVSIWAGVAYVRLIIDVSSRMLRRGERPAEIGAVPSIAVVGDSFDNALAEVGHGGC